MIAAGVNAKALSTFMGHATITITLDRYGHLFPGSEDEAAGLLDAYLERANTAARLAALDDAENSEGHASSQVALVPRVPRDPPGISSSAPSARGHSAVAGLGRDRSSRAPLSRVVSRRHRHWR